MKINKLYFELQGIGLLLVGVSTNSLPLVYIGIVCFVIGFGVKNT